MLANIIDGERKASMNNDDRSQRLQDYTNEELEAELEMRHNRLRRPDKLSFINWDNVIMMCESYLDDVEEGMSDDDESDARDYMFEGLMEAVYSKDVWKWKEEMLND